MKTESVSVEFRSVVAVFERIALEYTYRISSLSATQFTVQKSNSVTKFHTGKTVLETLRDPAPKKRPMISGSKIESADFYLSSRGYRILFIN